MSQRDPDAPLLQRQFFWNMSDTGRDFARNKGAFLVFMLCRIHYAMEQNPYLAHIPARDESTMDCFSAFASGEITARFRHNFRRQRRSTFSEPSTPIRRLTRGA